MHLFFLFDLLNHFKEFFIKVFVMVSIPPIMQQPLLNHLPLLSEVTQQIQIIIFIYGYPVEVEGVGRVFGWGGGVGFVWGVVVVNVGGFVRGRVVDVLFCELIITFLSTIPSTIILMFPLLVFTLYTMPQPRQLPQYLEINYFLLLIIILFKFSQRSQHSWIIEWIFRHISFSFNFSQYLFARVFPRFKSMFRF